MGKLEDEAAINAAWAILKAEGIADGMLGVYYREPQETFVLHYEEEASGYTEWVRLNIKELDNLPLDVLEEAGQRLAKRIRLTRPRHPSSADASMLN